MNHHIIQDGGRCKHEAPVKGQSALGAATAPAGLLVTDGNAVVDAAGKCLEIGRPSGEIFPGSFQVSFFQSAALCLI